MAIHKPYDRTVVLAPHAKMSTVGSLLLGKGQVGIYDVLDTDKDGMKAVTSFAGRRTDEKRYQILIGASEDNSRTGTFGQPYASPVFSIDEITDIYASAPKSTRMQMDDVIIGYNGADEKTGFTFKKGSRIKIELELTGERIGMLGYPGGKATFQEYILADDCHHGLGKKCVDCNPCDDVECLEPTLNAIERLKRQWIDEGTTVGDLIDITPVHKCAQSPAVGAEEDMKFFCMAVCDTGDDFALAQVRNQYPGVKIQRVAVDGSMSKYQALTSKPTLEAYKQHLSSIMKGCEDCPATYTEVKGGLIYAITLEDEGEDKKAAVQAIAHAVAGTAEKMKGQKNGVGLYVVAVDKKLTQGEVDAFVATNPTATVTYLTKTSAMCANPNVTTVAWSECGSCKVTKHKYYITIPDNECGKTSIEELQAAYPDLTIEAYDATMPPAGCQHSFVTEVVTNMVCKECNDVFKDFYRSEAPASYLGRQWTKVEGAPAAQGCVCGIRFRAKEMLLSPDDCMMDKVGYIEDAIRIAVRGGYPDEFNENHKVYNEPLHTEYLERFSPRTHRGADFVDDERAGVVYFTGFTGHDYHMARVLRGEVSGLELNKQYADISFTIRPARMSNGFGGIVHSHTTFHMVVEFGAHDGVVEMVNMMGASAGLKPVKL